MATKSQSKRNSEMTTRDNDGAAAGADNGDIEKTINSTVGTSLSNNQTNGTAASPNTAHGAHSKSWFRSIPRRIRKFIARHQHRSTNSATVAANDSAAYAVANTDAVYLNQTFVSDGDGADESNLYSIVDYMGNDEEVAMIRACSQMAR